MDGWIVIPNWRRFQHYRNRQPPWIKVYTELNSSDEWLALSLSARGLLVTCWLEYARSRGQLRIEQIRGMFGPGFKHAYLESLRDAGLIRIVASKPLALVSKPASKVASPEVRSKSKTTEGASTGARKRAAGATAYGELMAAAHRYAAGWNGGTSDAFDAGLDELEETYRLHLEAGDRYRLWDEAIQVKH